MDTHDRLFGWRHAFDHPGTVAIVAGAAAILVFATVLVEFLGRSGRVGADSLAELRHRLRSWWVLAPLIVGPILLGAAWAIGAVGVLSILCYREFARATGVFRDREVSALVVLGILAVTFAALDHWYGLFMALSPLTVVLIASVAVAADRPKGYIQRTALGVFAFAFFGSCLGHLGYFANDAGYRPVLLLIFAAVELNDVFAYVCGRLFGKRKLAPQTSPNKTWAGAIGAVVLTGLLMQGLGRIVFADTAVDHWLHLLALGLIVAVGGQLGDLMLSSIKRDLGIKDFAATIPGHGGLLDRFDSLILVAPAVYHYVGYLQGIGLDQSTRIITGG